LGQRCQRHYHKLDSRFYGKTKNDQYMFEADAVRAATGQRQNGS